MSIEFRCVQCDKLLRMPEATGGQQAQCPACAAVMTVPEPADSVGPPQQYGPASPSIRPTPIRFADVIDRTWRVFAGRWRKSVAVFVAWLTVNGCFGLVVAGTSLAVIFGASLTRGQCILVLVLAGLVVWFFMLWTRTGLTLFFIRVARGLEAQTGDLFAGGPYLLRVIGASILYGLGMLVLIGVVALPCALIGWTMSAKFTSVGFVFGSIVGVVPAIIFALCFAPVTFLIIDQNMGIVESFSTSYEVTRGNRVTMFWILLAIGLIGSAIDLVTWHLSTVVVTPFIILLYAVMCLVMIGHPTAAGARGAAGLGLPEAFGLGTSTKGMKPAGT